MQIIKGRQPVAPKVMISGLPGSGKSSLAATLPNALFFDIEGGLSFLDVVKTPTASARELMKGLIELLNATEQKYKYIVIDSVDWAVSQFASITSGSGQGKTLETLMESATQTLNKSQGGYGNGKQVLGNYIKDVLIKVLSALNRKGYGVILITHADKQTILDADGYNVDRIAPQMDINSMKTFVEWVDNLFYIQRDDSGAHKLVVNPTDSVMAKNRIGIKKDELILTDDFDFESLITTGKATRAAELNKE